MPAELVSITNRMYACRSSARGKVKESVAVAISSSPLTLLSAKSHVSLQDNNLPFACLFGMCSEDVLLHTHTHTHTHGDLRACEAEEKKRKRSWSMSTRKVQLACPYTSPLPLSLSLMSIIVGEL